jgi:hypothetical protein
MQAIVTMNPTLHGFQQALNPGDYLENMTAKTAGLGALAKVLYDSQKSGSIKGIDSLLPFAIGAMADPEPGQEMFGQNQYTSSRWYS